jgi:hypothetical protein
MINEEYLRADGFNKAIIGIDMVNQKVIYDKLKMIEILVEDDGMTEEDAIEYLAYNVWSAYVGEFTPIYMDDVNSDYLDHLQENYKNI